VDETSGQRLVVIEPILRRVISGRVPAPAVDDLVQETLLRLAGPAERLHGDELHSYAAVSARNAVASYHRAVARRSRAEASMIDLTQPDGPEVAVLDREEAETMRGALAGLDPSDRSLLESHHVEDTSVATLARSSDRTEMAVRLSLSRARARLRVDYTVARENAELPTSRCRPVLLALASGDRRAQERLAAQDHLETCTTCAALVAPSTGKHRPAAGLLPVLVLWWKELSIAGRRAVSIASAATAATAVAVVAVVASADDPEAASPPTPTTLTAPTTAGTAPTTAATPPTTGIRVPTTGVAPPSVPGQLRVPDGPLLSSPAGLAGATGQSVVAQDAPVIDVPADEGFWIGSDDGGRIWVQMVGGPGESPVTIRAGSTVTFTGGLVIEHGPEMPGAVGLAPGPEADELVAQGHHIEVPLDAVRTI